MNINLHIERVVLDGLSVASGEAMLEQTAVETELGRLLARERFVRPESSAQAHVRGGEIRLLPDVNPCELGVKIGRSVFASLTPDGFRQNGRVKCVPGLSVSLRAFETQ